MRQAEAALAVDRAAIAAARLNLNYTEIRAPFAGRLGRNQAAKGALVGPSTGPLNTLVELDPIYVSFNPSESDLGRIAEARAAGKVEAEISLSDKPEAVRKGDLTFLDNSVDKATGTIAARVTIANPDFALLPGQYVRVRLHIRDEPNALMAPQAALGSSQMGKYVYVVGAGRQGGDASSHIRAERRTARERGQGPQPGRSDHCRQSAEDRAGLAGPGLAVR